jgi:hypothetical protein
MVSLLTLIAAAFALICLVALGVLVTVTTDGD